MSICWVFFARPRATKMTAWHGAARHLTWSDAKANLKASNLLKTPVTHHRCQIVFWFPHWFQRFLHLMIWYYLRARSGFQALRIWLHHVRVLSAVKTLEQPHVFCFFLQLGLQHVRIASNLSIGSFPWSVVGALRSSAFCRQLRRRSHCFS